jgi:hypothetical protein
MKQKTTKGYEIPIPKRRDFLDTLEKVSTPEKPSKRGPKKK